MVRVLVNVHNQFQLFWGLNHTFLLYHKPMSDQEQPIWKIESDDQRDQMLSAWEFIDEECRDLQKELDCPKSFIHGMLLALATSWEES
ncbi:hypothetical protein OAK25_00620 [Synechococcus sp. AH-551-P10]|nr:hypothetical protein [Synechococcus sp. AH-551-P10]